MDLSVNAQNAISNCSVGNEANVRKCIGGVLDDYSAGLENLKQQLPPQLQSLPNIVATAAKRVRAATTTKQAVQALKVAISAVRKTISLLRADDPLTLQTQTREGQFVSQTLEVANLKLEKAAGL